VRLVAGPYAEGVTVTVAKRAADALLEAGTRARRRMESRTAVDRYERTFSAGGSRGPVERPRGARARRHRRGPVLARRIPGRDRRARPGGGAREEGRRPVHPFARAALPRRHRDQRRGGPRQGRGLDESLAAAEALDEPWACTRTLLFAGWVPWTRGDHEGAEAGATRSRWPIPRTDGPACGRSTRSRSTAPAVPAVRDPRPTRPSRRHSR